MCVCVCESVSVCVCVCVSEGVPFSIEGILRKCYQKAHFFKKISLLIYTGSLKSWLGLLLLYWIYGSRGHGHNFCSPQNTRYMSFVKTIELPRVTWKEVYFLLFFIFFKNWEIALYLFNDWNKAKIPSGRKFYNILRQNFQWIGMFLKRRMKKKVYTWKSNLTPKTPFGVSLIFF